MKKQALLTTIFLLTFAPSLLFGQVEIKPLDVKEEEPYKAKDHYQLYGEVAEMTMVHYTKLIGEISMGTTERLKFNKKGLKTEEYVAYTGFLEMDFLTKFSYDSQDRLVEVKWVDAANPSQVDQVITYDYNDQNQIIKKTDKFSGNTKITDYERDFSSTTIKKYNNSGELYETVELKLDYLGLDVEEKKIINHTDNTTKYEYYTTDILFGYITQQIKEDKFGKTTTDFIFDEFTTVSEKKTALSSTKYEYVFDHINWISMNEI